MFNQERVMGISVEPLFKGVSIDNEKRGGRSRKVDVEFSCGRDGLINITKSNRGIPSVVTPTSS